MAKLKFNTLFSPPFNMISLECNRIFYFWDEIHGCITCIGVCFHGCVDFFVVVISFVRSSWLYKSVMQCNCIGVNIVCYGIYWTFFLIFDFFLLVSSIFFSIAPVWLTRYITKYRWIIYNNSNNSINSQFGVFI